MDKVKEIIAECFKIDPSKITMEMTPDNVENWDSLGQLMLISNLEKELNMTFAIEEIFEIMSIGDIYKILTRKGLI